MTGDHEVPNTPGQQAPASLDARRLRGLAHPMRVRILELLELDGASTATILAGRLGVRTGSTSWHLLKLAENGFVEEVHQRGDRRQRWWRAAQAGWSVDHAEFAEDAELADASETLLGAVLSQQMLRATRFLQEDWSSEWRASWILSTELGLHLDPAGLAAIRADIWAVIDKYRGQPQDRTDAESVEQVVFQMQGFPYRSARP